MRRIMLLLAAVTVTAPSCTSIHDRIYQPPTAALSTASLPAGAQLVTVATADGLRLTGAEVAPQAGRPTLLVFHGNASNATTTLRWFAPLTAAGYGVVAAEYRGYAGNPGRPDERGLAADADAFYGEARRVAAGGHLLVVGHSLGGGVAFGLARRQRLEALITVGTFTRLRAMAPRIARALVSDRYDNLATVATLDEPLFLIHGTADDTVPGSEAGRLRAAATAAHKAGEAFAIKGADHHPDGVTMAAIVAAIAARIEHPEAPPPALPANVVAIPLG